jgi:hypothetical protein
MLFGATDSSARTNDPVSRSAKPTRPPGLPAPRGYSSSSCSWEPEPSITF